MLKLFAACANHK